MITINLVKNIEIKITLNGFSLSAPCAENDLCICLILFKDGFNSINGPFLYRFSEDELVFYISMK